MSKNTCELLKQKCMLIKTGYVINYDQFHACSIHKWKDRNYIN